MGKPFSKELEVLNHTYLWAALQDIDSAVRLLKNTSAVPLLSVGSGGSYSAAELQVTFHRYFFQSIAMAVTPVEMISALPRDGNASVWVLTASGNNIDIRRAFQHAALLEPCSVNALIGRAGSKLSALHQRYQYTNVYEFPLPSGKDGFLASNSLLGFATLLYRIYSEAAGQSQSLPSSLDDLIRLVLPDSPSLDLLHQQTSKIWEQRALHVVYSDRLKSIAIDIESKFIEAGLGSVHLADMRNFAHGRHHWFDKNPENSGILFLSTDCDQDLAQRTLKLLPDSLAKGHLNIKDLNGLELIGGIVLSLYFTSWRGERFGIDPGRPGVPEYGSKIYRLTAPSGFVSSLRKDAAASLRKSRSGPRFDNSSNWLQAYRQFTRRLANQRFQGIVLDYDGTVVDGRKRHLPPSEEICQELDRLLAGGITLGFATGRGKSIRKDLQSDGVIATRYWDQVVVGYYNGSEIGYLSNNDCPDRSGVSYPGFCGVMEQVTRVLDQGAQSADITRRKYQFTVETKEPMSEVLLWETVCGVIDDWPRKDLSVVRSSHSVDILAPGVTKTAVIDYIVSRSASDGAVLAIGDRGRWPGNDRDLLASEYSLSVDEVSPSPISCWNLCPAGIRGPQGTLNYLSRIECENGFARFR